MYQIFRNKKYNICYILLHCINLCLFFNFLYQQCHFPTSIVYCINEIERKGFYTIGLYRISGSDKEAKRFKERCLKGVPNLDNIDIHVLCSCLKVFIRMHTGHLISQNNFSYFADVLKNYRDVTKSFCQGVIKLPLPNRSILAFLILHLKKYSITTILGINSSKISFQFLFSVELLTPWIIIA